MAILAEINGKATSVFPENTIILLNGRTLDCHPLAEEEQTKVEDDSMKLDTTGVYLTIRKKRPKPEPPLPMGAEEERNLFINNAFYLLAHKERIMSDSRMFMCPIAIQNGLAYTGTSGFSRPTLGIYIEWWLNCPGAMQTDKKGNRLLVYYLAGSPLSGMNHCMAVREDGQRKDITLSSFSSHWKPFMDINRRYTEAKGRYQTYSLQQVLDLLEQENAGRIDYNIIIENDFLKKEIKELSEKVDKLQEDKEYWYNKYAETVIRYNKTKIETAYAKYKDLEQETNKKIEQLRAQKKELKTALKSGLIEGPHYQRQLTPIKRQIGDLKGRLSSYKYKCVNEMFPEGDVTISMFEQYINKMTDKNEDND